MIKKVVVILTVFMLVFSCCSVSVFADGVTSGSGIATIANEVKPLSFVYTDVNGDTISYDLYGRTENIDGVLLGNIYIEIRPVNKNQTVFIRYGNGEDDYYSFVTTMAKRDSFYKYGVYYKYYNADGVERSYNPVISNDNEVVTFQIAYDVYKGGVFLLQEILPPKSTFTLSDFNGNTLGFVDNLYGIIDFDMAINTQEEYIDIMIYSSLGEAYSFYFDLKDYKGICVPGYEFKVDSATHKYNDYHRTWTQTVKAGMNLEYKLVPNDYDGFVTDKDIMDNSESIHNKDQLLHDKNNYYQGLLEQGDSLNKPNYNSDGLIINNSSATNVSMLTSLYTPLFNNSLIFKMLIVSLSFVLVGYVLFGKR